MRRAALLLLVAAVGVNVPVLAQPVDGASVFSGADGRSNVGPALLGERMRELGKPALRALIEDPMRANPATVMPPFGRHHILDAREIASLADYLVSLPAGLASTAPGESPPPSGDAAPVLEAGKALWNRKFKNGRTLAGCFPNGGRRVAGSYPQYDPRLKRIVTLEMAINQCLKTHGEALIDNDDPATMGAVVAYARSLSEQQRIAVRVPQAAEAKLAEGKRLYYTRMGQRNFACASCHIQAAGRRYDDSPLSEASGQAARAPTLRDGKAITLQARMRECLERMGAAPFPAASEELNHIEYFLTHLANGQAIRPNAPSAR
jgi:sulfur-oxidizing protein SoxA